MKKIYPVVFLLMLHVALAAQNGAYTTYRLVVKATGQCVTNENSELKMAEERTGRNAWSQFFIITRLDEQRVLLASASDNRLCLKRDGAGVVLSAYADADMDAFAWKLLFTGGSYSYLAAGDGQATVALKAEGNNTGMEQPPFIEGCDNEVADLFRLSLEPVTNTF